MKTFIPTFVISSVLSINLLLSRFLGSLESFKRKEALKWELTVLLANGELLDKTQFLLLIDGGPICVAHCLIVWIWCTLVSWGWVIYDAIFFFLSAFISFLDEQLDSDILERTGYDDRNFCFKKLTVYICMNIHAMIIHVHWTLKGINLNQSKKKKENEIKNIE